MKPAPFDYLPAASVEEALGVLAAEGGDAKVLAGGQSLVPLLALRTARPRLLVDLNPIPELAHVQPTSAGGLTVGAMTRLHELEVNPLVAERVPLAAEAAKLVGYRQIRNRGTIGGSLAYADPAAELPTVTVMLGATVVSRSPRGQRTTPAAEFFRGAYTTALAPDEVLTEVWFPRQPDRTGVAVLKVSRRSGGFAVVGAAAMVTLDDGDCTDARVVLFGVADAPVAVPGAADPLRGKTVTEARAREAGRAASAATRAASDLHASGAYRKQVAGVLTCRAVLAAAKRAAMSYPSTSRAR